MKIKELKKMIKDAFIAEAETDAEYFYSPVREDLDEADAQINIVTTMDGKTIVGTYQYGVGFKSNEAGKKMGFNDNPTSIPNGTKMSKDDLLNEVDDMTFVANLEAELAEGLYEAKYEDIDPETKEILNSLEGLRAKADDEKFETLLNTIVTMVRQYMYGDRKLNIGALKAAIEKGDFASLLKFQKTPNPGNPYMAEDLYEAEEEEEQTDVTIDAEEKTTNSRRRNNKKKSSNDSIVVGKKIVKLSSLSDEKQDILNSLETLRAQAEEFGDGKFETQVGNTITFFNRDFVVGGDKPTKEKVDESLEILRMRKLAGLLKEGEYAKALLNNINENTIPSVVDILKDPKLGLKHFAKLDAYDTKFKLKDDSLAIKKLPQLKGKEVEIGSYYDPRENLLTIKSGTTYTQVYPEEVEIIASTYTDNKEDYFKKNPTETLAKK